MAVFIPERKLFNFPNTHRYRFLFPVGNLTATDRRESGRIISAHMLRICMLFLLGLLAGCAQDAIFTPSAQMCGFVRHTLAVNFPSPEEEGEEAVPSQAPAPTTGPRTGATTPAGHRGPTERAPAAMRPTTLAPHSLAAELDRSLNRLPNGGRGPRGEAPAFLFLSGGSLHGAFGAGFLDAWRTAREREGKGFPQFTMVTGISTGSILATFAFTGQTDQAVAGYSITDESTLLRPYLKPSPSGGLGLNAGIALAKHGAVANLDPLRAHLGKYLTYRTLAAVADGRRQGRTLWVGAVDVDTGEAVAFDMVDMANRYIAAQPLPPTPDSPETVEALRLKDCYISAIMASSSAPIAAAPVFLDNRMYVDGGARFGLFGAEIGALIEDRRARAAGGGNAPAIPVTYAIVNGTLEVGKPDACPKRDDKLCTTTEPTGGLEGEHDPWTFIGLALRSEEILANQVYRFSAQRIGTKAGACEGCFNIVRIRPDAQSHPFTLDDRDLGKGTMSCADWRAEDRRLLNPVQFFPRYMRCIIDYGRHRKEVEKWASLTP